MSPTTSWDARTLSLIKRQIQSFRRPSSSILIALNWRPSAYASVASTIPHDPGVSAPRSRWCAAVAEKATSSPSWKIGTTKPTSGSCEAP